MKTTWAGLAANTQNAFRRMGEGILSALDDVFMGINGRNLIQNLLGFDAEGNEVGNSVKKVIDGISKSIQGWIRANPDYFIEFLDTLKQINWNGLLTGFGKGLLQTLDDIKAFAEFFSGQRTNALTSGIKKFFGVFGLKEAEDFGKFMARMPLYGRVLNIAGGLLKGMRGIIATIGTALAMPFLLRQSGRGGLFGIFGKMIGSPKSARQLTQTLKSLPSVGGMLKGLVKSLIPALTVLGNVALFTGAGVIAFGGIKIALEQLRGIVDIINGFSDADMVLAKDVATKIVAFLSALTAVSAGFGAAFMSMGVAGGTIAGWTLGIAGVIAGVTAIFSGIAALDMWFIKSAFKSFSEAISYLKKGLEEINQIKGLKVEKSAIQDVMESFNGAVALLHPKTSTAFGDRAITNFEASNIKKVMDNLAQAISSLKKITDTFKEARNFGGFSTSTVGNVKKIFRDLADIYNTIVSEFSGGGGKSGITEKGAIKVTNIIDSTKKTFDLLIGKGGLISQINSMSKKLPDITDVVNYDGSSIISKVTNQLDKLFDSIGDMYTTILKNINGGEGKSGISEKKSGEFKSILENTQGIFTLIVGENGLINQINKMAYEIPSVTSGSGYSGISKISQVKVYLTDLFDRISELYSDEVWKRSELLQAVNVDSQYRQVIENLQATFESIIGENGIISQINKMAQELPNLTQGRGYSGVSLLSHAVNGIKDLFLRLSDIYTYFKGSALFEDGDTGTFANDMENVKTAMGYISDAITTIGQIYEALPSLTGEDGEFTVATKIGELISSLTSAFNEEQVATLTGQITAFKQSISEALQSITDLGEEIIIESSVKLAEGFQTSVDDVVTTLENAAKAINDAWKLIPDSLSKTINVSVSYDTSRVQSFPNLNVPTHLNTGGYAGGMGKVLYRSKGGDIFGSIFKPKGKDIVPSMLAVGEYVHQKKAVDFWGIDFMRKVNRMDIRGVMGELTSKAMNNASRSSVVNNYYNNQKVIQNITTNSTDFAFRSASRFAGAF